MVVILFAAHHRRMSYVYDGNGFRVKKTEGAITTLYVNRYYEKVLLQRGVGDV